MDIQLYGRTSNANYPTERKNLTGIDKSPQQKQPCLKKKRKTSLILMNINNSLLELPSRNLAIEQDINLTIRPMLKLR